LWLSLRGREFSCKLFPALVREAGMLDGTFNIHSGPGLARSIDLRNKNI
jgi:hypothetical protein